jgi:hypothetical protein
MKGYSVYSNIQQLKEKGFKKAAVVKQLRQHRTMAKSADI